MQEIKDRIIEQAGNLFLRYGIKSVTMDDIAAELSISKKTIYMLFKDKNDIVCQVAVSHMENEKRKIDEIGNSARNAIEELHQYSVCMRDLFNSINPVILYDLKKYYKDAWDIFLDYKTNVFYHSLNNTLKKGISEGYFREDIIPDILAILRLEEFQMSMDSSVFPEDRFNFIEVQMQLFRHFAYGIVTEKGYKELDHYLKNQSLT